MNENLLKQVEEVVTSLLYEQYSRGLATGGKTFVALIYKTIIELESDEGKDEREILEEVKKLCRQLFDTNEKKMDLNQKETIEDVIKKMKEGE